MKKVLELLETRIWLTKGELKIEENTNQIQHLNSKLMRLEKLQRKLKK